MKMRHYLQSIAVASTIAITLLAAPATQAATEFQRVVNVGSGDVLNLRAAPGADSTVIGSIPHNGQTIVATGKRQGSWLQVNWAGQTGWVNKRFLQSAPQRPNRATNRDRDARIQSPARQTAQTNTAHSHPANACTQSVSHSHPGGDSAHEHHYACKQGQNISGVKPKFAPKFQQMDIKY